MSPSNMVLILIALSYRLVFIIVIWFFFFRRENKADPKIRYLHKGLHLFWVEEDSYESAKIFWEILANRNDKASYFPSLRSRAYKKLEKRRWINVANLDNGGDNLPAPARQFLHRLLNHAAVQQGVTTQHLPSIQMILKPDDTDRKAMAQQIVPACVPYIVLKKNRNPMVTDVNEYSSMEIEWLEGRSRWWKRSRVYMAGGEARQSLNQDLDLVQIEPSRPVRRLLPMAVPSLAGRNVDRFCSICLNDIDFNNRNEGYVFLTCFHGFHMDCILGWKQHHKDDTTCPICKRKLEAFVFQRQCKQTENNDSDRN